MSRTPMDAAHDRAAARLVAYASGLLGEPDVAGLEAHLAGCADCRARLETLRAPAGSGAGHLPASLIATWSRSLPRLGELERRLVASHLAACEDCRAALRFAGHEPVVAPAPRAERARVLRLPRRVWGLALSGAAVAAAVWLVFVGPALQRRDTRTSATMGAPADTSAPALRLYVEPAPAPDGLLELPVPAAPGSTPVLDLAAASLEAGVRFRLPAEARGLASDSLAELDITVTQAGRAHAELHMRHVNAGSAIRLVARPPVAHGRYVLRVQAAGAPGVSRTWDVTLDVR